MAKVIQLLMDLDQLQKKALDKMAHEIFEAKYGDESRRDVLGRLDSEMAELKEGIDTVRIMYNKAVSELKENAEIYEKMFK